MTRASFRYCVVDGPYLFHRSEKKKGLNFKTSSGFPTTGIYFFLQTLIKLKNDYNIERFFIAWSDTDNYRYDIDPEYKGGKSTPGTWDSSMLRQSKVLFELLDKLSICQFIRESSEADDAIPDIIQKACKPWPTLIFTADKDLYQALNGYTTMYHDRKKKLITKKDFKKSHSNIDPSQYAYILALAGDKADGITGLDGIGTKRAIKLLKKHQSWQELLSTLPPEQQKLVSRNLKLTLLRYINKPLNRFHPPSNFSSLNHLLQKLEFKKLNESYLKENLC